MAYQAGGQRSAPRPVPENPVAEAYLRDYVAFLEAVPFPSLVVDHRWDVVLTNGAFRTLFAAVGPHPTAMPDDNFLRFVLFHPDAGAVLGEHEARWCLPMLADFAAAVERHGHDVQLQSIRRDIAQDPIMDAAYRQGLPHWIRAVGAAGVEHDGAVRPLLHPDPRWGATDCRIVCETPRALEEMGYSRLTMVLREPRRPSSPPPHQRARARRRVSHLRVVPTPES
ncbi:MmyB family transcriptional regulator [Streptomyces flavalbus]|uniref:MmyB-like transcription regulator ligand binding domain-containing protein n=1 Tax=Streptomyces flavalbus TaxID=2665155 RepID=A0ABW2WG52_9ACTN